MNRLTAQFKALSVAAALPLTATISAQEAPPFEISPYISFPTNTVATVQSLTSDFDLGLATRDFGQFSRSFLANDLVKEQILPSAESLNIRLQNQPPEFWVKIAERALRTNQSPHDCLNYFLRKNEQPPLSAAASIFLTQNTADSTRLVDNLISEPQIKTTVREKLSAALKQMDPKDFSWWHETIAEAEKNSIDWLLAPPGYLVDRIAFKNEPRTCVIKTLLDLDLSDLQLLFSRYSQDECYQGKLAFIIKKRLGDPEALNSLFGASDVRPTCQSIWSNIYNNAIRTRDPEIIAAAETVRAALNMGIYRIERFSQESLQEIIAARQQFFNPQQSIDSSHKFVICFYPASDNSSAFSNNTIQYHGPTYGLLRAALQSNSLRPVYFEISNDDELKQAFQQCAHSKNMPNVLYVELSGHGSQNGQDLAWTEASDTQNGYLSFTAQERPSVMRQMRNFLASSKGGIQAVVISSCYSYLDQNSLSQQLSSKLQLKVIALQESGLIPIKLDPSANWKITLSGHTRLNCATVVLKSGKVIEQIASPKKE